MTAYYYENIHLKDAVGTIFLKNVFLPFWLTHPEKMPRVRKRANMNDPRDNVVYSKNFETLRVNNAKPYRSRNNTNYDFISKQHKYMHQKDTQFGHTNQTYK